MNQSCSRKFYPYILRASVLFFFVFFSVFQPTGAETPKQTLKFIRAIKIETPVVIDGSLDEEIWKQDPSVDDIFITYNPGYEDLFPQKTRIWVAYDSRNIYFAFHCLDEEPGKIKTSVTRRDNIFSDDWVGLGIDTMGNRQSLYELMVNPSGMQGDLYNTPSNGENSSPDWVWYSGGKVVEDGYTVEIRLPLKSIRFKSGENVIANILFWRRCSRMGVSGSWPRIDPGRGLFNSLGPVEFGKLPKQLKLEFIPSVTYGSISDRESPDQWSGADDRADLGISAKVGLNSTTTLDFTLNPDFSQVESDTFQVTHNLRYPIFYSEKRPFFMEAGDMFNLSGPGSNMWSAVHTRKIVDPEWGTRITGSSGKLTYGGLISSDDWEGREFGDEENYYLGKKALYSVGRLKYGLGGDNHIGILYSGKELGDYSNRVVSIDSLMRLGKSNTVRANAILSGTRDPEADERFSGGAFSAMFSHSTPTFYGSAEFEVYDRDFRMDTAFYQRTGISRASISLVPRIAVKFDKFKWIKTFQPVFMATHVHDHVSGLNDLYLNVGFNMYFTRQGSLTLAWDIADHEGWEGEVYKKSAFWGGATVQILKWLQLHSCFNYGGSIYYDEDDPFLGKKFRIHSFVKIQPDSTVSLYFSHEYTDFDRKDTGEDVYDYHIFYNKSTWQPSKHLRFRALLQYDSYLDLVMGDALASYEFVPGTVFHIGYGCLCENLEWDPREREWLSDTAQRKFYQMTRSFFVKISYRLQF